MGYYNHMVLYEPKMIEVFELTKEILNEHPNGYYNAMIWGKKGRGKSSYCIHTMKQVFMELSKLPDEVRYEHLDYKITVKEAYEMALNHIVFDIIELIEKCKKGRGGLTDPRKMIPILTWDDAGVGGSSYLFFTDMPVANALKGYNDILRRRVTGFLINTPNIKGLLSFLRDEEDLGVPTIKCTKEYEWERIATARIKKEGRKHRQKLFVDEFSCYLPKWVYKKYVDLTEKSFDAQEEIISKLIEQRRKQFPQEKIPEELKPPKFPEPI